MSAAPPAGRQFLKGRPASPGLARGPIVMLAERTVAAAGPAADPAVERLRLASAVAAAGEAIADLAARQTDPEAEAILEFQLALLGDDALTEEAYAAIDGGATAASAWDAALSAMADGYAAADDEYFRARAADISDLAGRVHDLLAGGGGAALDLPAGAILYARDLTPSRFLGTDWSEGRAIALGEGSPTAHVAILARARGIPMVVGLGSAPIDQGIEEALLDGERGLLILSPDAEDLAAHGARAGVAAADRAAEAAIAARPAVTADGETITVMINAGDPADLERLDPGTTDGIGLVRSEFLFHDRPGLPDEEEQLSAYRRLARWAGGRPVVIRTLDAGGDKPVPGLTRAESNPFLGLRGVRLSLARPEVFRVQIRALLRAAAEGAIDVMVPMVALPGELSAVRALFREEAGALARAGLSHRMPRLGMMVEVPAAALTLDLFETDFVSIGSNDLTQYVMAASREAGDLGAGLDDAGSAAVLRLIAMVIAAGRERGIPVSLCGDAGADPAILPRLLALGLTSVSVAPASIGRVKRQIAGLSRKLAP